MTPVDLSHWANVATIASGIATVLFVFFAAISAVQFLAQLRRDSYQNITTRMLEIDEIFFEHPELRPYFYEGVAVPANADPLFRGKVRSMTELVTDVIDNVLVEKPHMGRGNWRTWQNFFEFIYQNSPEMSDYLMIYPDWYTDELKALANQARLKIGLPALVFPTEPIRKPPAKAIPPDPTPLGPVTPAGG